tara:strand:- start:666 stop:1601 length:936 start_codon:yes stop_codon:yes gene_type:complete
MARHLIIGDGTTRSTANPVEDGAITIQKMSSSGPTDLVLGDSIVDAPQIRIVGGGSDGKDIVTPWIYGRDVINWSGKSYTAAQSHKQTVTYAGTTTEAADIVIKFIRTDGPTPEFYSFATAIASGQAHTAVDATVTTAYAALDNLPDWLETACTDTGNANVFEGSIRGQVAQSGNTWDYAPVTFEVVAESLPAGLTATVSGFGSADTQVAKPGYGDGFAVKAFEESLMGASHGYYNRVKQPIAPTTQAATGSNYDMYSIVATKDGSSASQINGVDNLIELNVAAIAGDADSAIFENKLNGYFAGVFPNVTL